MTSLIPKPPASKRDVAIVVVATVLFALSLALRSAFNVWITIGTSSILLLVTAATGERSLPVWGRHNSMPSVAYGVGSGLALAALTYLAYPLAQGIPGLEGEVAALYDDLRDSPGPVLGLPLLLLAVLAEEVVWRGVLMRRLSWRQPWVAIAIATVAYAIPQAFSGSWVLVLVALGCGGIWTTQRHWSGGIAVPALTHAVWNCAVFVIYPLG